MNTELPDRMKNDFVAPDGLTTADVRLLQLAGRVHLTLRVRNIAPNADGDTDPNKWRNDDGGGRTEVGRDEFVVQMASGANLGGNFDAFDAAWPETASTISGSLFDFVMQGIADLDNYMLLDTLVGGIQARPDYTRVETLEQALNYSTRVPDAGVGDADSKMDAKLAVLAQLFENLAKDKAFSGGMWRSSPERVYPSGYSLSQRTTTPKEVHWWMLPLFMVMRGGDSNTLIDVQILK